MTIEEAHTNKGLTSKKERMKMTNITVDQLIADLAVVRGKSPEIGGFFIHDSYVFDGTWGLEITNGIKKFTLEIESAHEDGHEFDAVAVAVK